MKLYPLIQGFPIEIGKNKTFQSLWKEKFEEDLLGMDSLFNTCMVGADFLALAPCDFLGKSFSSYTDISSNGVS